MDFKVLASEVFPTMLQAWVGLAFLIVFLVGVSKAASLLYKLIKPIIEPVKAKAGSSQALSFKESAGDWYESFKMRWLAAPENISMAVKSAWRGRERGLAIFSGVFLSSLVITTVLAYAVGLNQGFFQFALEQEVFDAKIDMQEEPIDGNWDVRTNNSDLWESMCDEFLEMDEFSDCGLVFGRQGIRVSGFFDQNYFASQPLNVEDVSGSTGDWENVSWNYPEAIENGPPTNDKRTIRFYGDGVWDGELGERHSKSIIFGDWPSTAADAEANRSVILPSKIASSADVEVGDTLDNLTFSYVIGQYNIYDVDVDEIYENCNGTTDFNAPAEYVFCKRELNVTNLKVTAIYEEGDFGNPTLLFHPVIVSDSVLSDEQKTILTQNDHAYLGMAVDRTEIPTASTSTATRWLGDLKKGLEEVKGDVRLVDPTTNESYTAEGVTIPRLMVLGPCSDQVSSEMLLEIQSDKFSGENISVGQSDGEVATYDNFTLLFGKSEQNCQPNFPYAFITVEYTDIISGTITFLNILLGFIQVFDYILVIPIVALSFVVLIYGLVLSLEQRRREVSIHRVIGGTEDTLSRMMVLEIYAIGTVAWALGFALASGAVEIVLRAVGFLRFTEAGEIDVNPVLSFASTLVVTLLTVGVAYYYGKKRTSEFLSIEIDEGVRRVAKEKEPNYLLQWAIFTVGLLSYVESWIESRGGFWRWGGGGIIESFIPNAIVLLLGPFFLWIGGALVLSRIGAAGPQILNRLAGWTPAISDIRRGLSGSGSSSSVNRLSLIMLLTLSIVTLAAVQGHTGTLVDERTTNSQNGADLKIQFDSPLTEQEVMTIVNSSIRSVDDNDISEIVSMTSVGSILTSLEEGGSIPTWILFDGHEDTLIWDKQAIPGDEISTISSEWGATSYTAGSGLEGALKEPIVGQFLTIQYTTYSLNQFGIPEVSGVENASVKYVGRHNWVPGYSPAEADNSMVIGEGVYRSLVGGAVADSYSSTIWMFELCEEKEKGCADALETLSADLSSVGGVVFANDWSSTHEQNERNGGLIFGTPGLLSMMFVVAALASVSSAFVFLSLVLSQRKRELAILQAIGASPNQVVRLVLFEIMSILLVSIFLGVTLGLAVSESFNGFFGIFGFLFQLFLGQSDPISRDLVWPWMELVIVNGLVLVAVIASLLFTTRRALKSDLAVVLKGE